MLGSISERSASRIPTGLRSVWDWLRGGWMDDFAIHPQQHTKSHLAFLPRGCRAASRNPDGRSRQTPRIRDPAHPGATACPTPPPTTKLRRTKRKKNLKRAPRSRPRAANCAPFLRSTMSPSRLQALRWGPDRVDEHGPGGQRTDVCIRGAGSRSIRHC